MKRRLVPALAVAYYVLMAVAVTYPGYAPFSRIRPFVLGLPFALFWQLLWISGAVLVLTGVFFWEKHRQELDSQPGGQPTPPANAADE